jgi:hypothetical protein
MQKFIDMRKLFITIFSINFILTVNSQDVIIKLFAEDNLGRKDTIVFGLNETSTLGIDSVLGEKDIFGKPFDSIDIRIIQRDSINFNCIRESHFHYPPAPNLYFPNNIDSKIDFRPFDGFHSVYNNFEILVKAIEYPVKIISEFSNINGSYLESWSSIHLLFNNCDSYENRPIDSYLDNDTIFTLLDSSFNTLVANFQHEVDIKDLNSNTCYWFIYPNPTNSYMTIYGLQNSCGTIEIINVLGQRLRSFPLIENKKLIFNIENIPSGIYLIRYFNPIEKTLSIRRLIKK